MTALEPRPPLVDIHCHVLAGFDDGAADADESLAMARLAAADGIASVVATPHQLGSFRKNRGEAIRRAVAALGERLAGHGVALRVFAGAEVRIEPDLAPKIRDGEVLTLADQGRHVLLELPHEVYLPVEPVLEQLHAAGLAGILAHPERNLGILHRPKVLERLADAGCLMQLTAGSLAGTFGPQVQGLAERLLLEGYVHFVATDAHSAQTRRPMLRRAWDRVAQLGGLPTACELCCGNPASVVAGRQVLPGRRRPVRSFRSGWSFWRKAS